MNVGLAHTEKKPMKRLSAGIEGLVLILALLLVPHPASASEWSTTALQARPLDITANGDVLWVCGADELIANSTDGGKTWKVQHLVTGGAVLLAIGTRVTESCTRQAPAVCFSSQKMEEPAGREQAFRRR